MVLAELSDVEIAAGRTLTPAEFDRAAGLLEVASQAVIRAAGGRRFEPGDYTITRTVYRGQVALPAYDPEVTAVREIDPATGAATTVTGWTHRRGRLYGVDARLVEVDFTQTAPVPADVVAITAGIVAATLNSPAVGAASETVGPFQVSYADSSGRVWLSGSDREVLRGYRPKSPARSLL